MIRINGEDSEVIAGATVAELLEQLEAPDRGVAVAIDGEVVPRSTWASTRLEDEAKVEVVIAVQGG